MKYSEIEKAAIEAFAKIIDKEYSRIYRPGGRPYVVDEIIETNKLDKDDKKLNPFKDEFKAKLIASIVPEYERLNNTPKKEVLEILKIESGSRNQNIKPSNDAITTAENYLKAIDQLRKQFNDIIDKIKRDKEGIKMFNSRELRIIVDYHKHLDLVREYTRIGNYTHL